MSRGPSLPTREDLAAWRNLVRRVDEALAGSAATGDLDRAVQRATRAVGLPPVSREAACFQLLRGAQAWLAASPLQRAAGTPELAGLADTVRAQLAQLATPPQPRFRADLDG